MKKILIALGILFALIGGIAVAGATMDRDHVSTRSVSLSQPRDAVFATLMAVEAYPSWRRDVESVDVEGRDPLRFTEHGDNGDLPMKVASVDAPSRLVMAINSDELPFGGNWTYAIDVEGDGSRVTITERGFVDNVFMRFFAGVFMDPAASQTRYLEDLGRHYNEDVTPTEAPPV